METTIRVMGQKIRQLRMDNRLTLEEAAERVGCTPGFLSQVERNIVYSSLSISFPDRKLETLLAQIDPVDRASPAYEFCSHPGEEFILGAYPTCFLVTDETTNSREPRSA